MALLGARVAREGLPRIALHGTLRQWGDEGRPWIARERDAMLRAAEDSDFSVYSRTYLAPERTMAAHFGVLDAFRASLPLLGNGGSVQ